MTLPDALSRLEELVARMTPGPWRSDGCGDVWTEAEKEFCPGMQQEIFRIIGGTRCGPDRGDAAGIAALRNAAEALLACAKALQFYRDLDWKVNTEAWQMPARDALSRLAQALGGNGNGDG